MPRYRIVPERSRVFIDARSSLHPIRSSTDGLEGFIDLPADGDGRAPAPGTGTLSLAVTRLTSGNRLEDRELHRRIEARRYPTIDGVVHRMERAGSDGRYRVTGDVVFRGVTRRYEDEVELEHLDDTTVRIAGQATFDVRDFGMEPPRILMLRVLPDVVVRIDVVARQEDTHA